MPFTCDDIKVDIRPEHRCSTKKDSKIQCIVSLASSVSVSIHWDVSTIGMEHSILFVYCICEALAITLARAELWPVWGKTVRCLGSLSHNNCTLSQW